MANESAAAADFALHAETASGTATLRTAKRKPKSPRTFDGSSGDAVPIPRTPLKTLDHVRNEMAKVYRGMKRGHILAEDGTKCVYVLAQLGKVIEMADLERRLEVLERAAQPGLLPSPAAAGKDDDATR